MKKIFCLILVVFSLWSVTPVLAAGPMLKFSPISGSYTNGSTFQVTVGVDSGTEKSQAVDAWVTFDAAKLEVVSIDQASSPAFSFTLGKNIYNSEGKFDLSCVSNDMSTYTSTVLNGDLAVVTFKAKATGTAAVNFTCQQGSTIDSNIFNTASSDVITCASNQNASFTITSGGAADPTAAPTSEPESGATTATLPQTGSTATTIGLLIFGMVGILSSWALRFL